MLIKRQKIPIKEILIYGFLPSFLKKTIYRLKGYNLGRHISIGFGSVIIGKNIRIEDFVKIGFFTIIRANKLSIGRFVKIGSFSFLDTERIEIGEDTRINEQVIIGGIRTPDSLFRIGKRGIIMEYSFINPTKPIIIGDDTGFGGYCLLFTHGSWLSKLDGFPVTFGPIEIGNNVWFPWHVFVLPNVKIGNNVVIGANSFVASNIPSNCLANGSPAKVVINNFPHKIDDERKNKLLLDMIEDFVKHLTYNNLKTSKFCFGEGDFKVIVEKSKKKYFLDYLTSNIHGNELVELDNLLILNNNSFNIDEFKTKYKMIIDIKKKERFGTSDIGEEFTSFLSRYGVRFNRID